MRAPDRNRAGTYGAPRTALFSPSGGADGIAVDEDGCPWVALDPRSSLGRFTPDGDLDAEIRVDGDFVASVCFAGEGRRDLFITPAGNLADPKSRGGVFVARAPVIGLAVPKVHRLTRRERVAR